MVVVVVVVVVTVVLSIINTYKQARIATIKIITTINQQLYSMR